MEIAVRETDERESVADNKKRIRKDRASLEANNSLDSTQVREINPVDQIRAVLGSQLQNPQSISGLFTSQKEPLQDLHVIKDWNEETKLDYHTRIMNPYEMSAIETLADSEIISLLFNEDELSAKIVTKFVKKYKRNMISFEGKRIAEEIEGLRARKQNEETGLDLTKTKSLKNFLLGDRSTV